MRIENQGTACLLVNAPAGALIAFTISNDVHLGIRAAVEFGDDLRPGVVSLSYGYAGTPSRRPALFFPEALASSRAV